MELCGNLCTSRNYGEFILKCIFCTTEIEVEKWQEFTRHIRNNHRNCFVSDWTPDPIHEEEEAEIDYANSYFKYESDSEHEDRNPEIIDHFDQEEQFHDMAKCEGIPEQHLEDTHTSSSNDKTNLCIASDFTGLAKSKSDEGSFRIFGPTEKFNPTFYRRNPRTKKFIELYKKQTCLWNSSDVDYGNKSTESQAYKQLIKEMGLLQVNLNERSIKTAIKKLREQYSSLVKKTAKCNQKMNSVVSEYFESCQFLRETIETEENVNERGIEYQNLPECDKIKLLFLKKNELTSSLIELYRGFPQLYEKYHKDFSNMKMRKEAYEAMSAELQISEDSFINNYDIIRAIQQLRQWYYKNLKKPALTYISAGEHYYMKKCDFLQPRMFIQRLPCEICQKLFFSDLAVQAHMYKKHNVGEMPYKCTLCERSFENRTEMVTHNKRAHIGKTHKCEYCERSFAVSADLKMHTRTHTGNKSYVCELCGKAFRIKTQLGYHTTAIHTKIRAFKCTMCPKDFLKNRDLKDHIKAHLNIRDKICETCGKGFTNCHSLIRHRQIHSEVKKFVCKLCDARFSQFVGLNSHMKRAHNILRRATKMEDTETLSLT